MTRARDTADIVQDVSVELALKANYSLPVNTRSGTTYTFALADDSLLTAATSASAQTFTIPPQSSVAWTANDILRVVNYGAGALTIVGGAGVTVTNTASTIAQYQSAAVIRTAENAWTLLPFSGGVSSANFSNTATGTYTGYKYVTFNASGTLTVTKAGTCDLLVVGAGGGGATGNTVRGAGGGAGQHMYLTNYFLPIGDYTVTIPGGGAIGTRGTGASIGDIRVAGGGGANAGVGASGAGGRSDAGAGAGSILINGFSGGSGGGPNYYGGGGGGGSAGAGGASTYNPHGYGAYQGGGGGAGGAGTANSITGTSVTRAGGGGGAHAGTGTAGGANGGVVSGTAGAATANTGSGGGGGGNGSPGTGSAGASGVVIIRVAV
jgi:hypothetical protein